MTDYQEWRVEIVDGEGYIRCRDGNHAAETCDNLRAYSGVSSRVRHVLNGGQLLDLEAKLRKAAGWETESAPGLLVVGPIHALIEAGASLDLDVLPIVKQLSHRCETRTSWKYFVPAARRAWQDRINTVAAPDARQAHENADRAMKAFEERARRFGLNRETYDQLAMDYTIATDGKVFKAHESEFRAWMTWLEDLGWKGHAWASKRDQWAFPTNWPHEFEAAVKQANMVP